jgi:4a-hydroxytetrahydrobiopterin dehydratase
MSGWSAMWPSRSRAPAVDADLHAASLRAERQSVDDILSVVSEPHAQPITSESLAHERCVELRAGTPPLTTGDAQLLAGAIAREWIVDDGEIHREFAFKTFNAAFGLATRIALLAEAQNHHPELEVAWGRLAVRLTTHSVGGLSRNDFIMAARIDRLAGG